MLMETGDIVHALGRCATNFIPLDMLHSWEHYALRLRNSPFRFHLWIYLGKPTLT